MKSRVITAAILAPIVLLLLAAPGVLPTAVLAWIIVVLGAWEIGAMTESDPRTAAAIAGVLGLSLFGPGNSAETLSTWGAGLTVAGLLAARFLRGMAGLLAVGWVIGPMYAVVAIAKTRSLGLPAPDWHVPWALLAIVLPVWAGDIAAIFAGRAFGHTPLAPAISPNKTVEGSIASLLATTAVAVPLLRHALGVAGSPPPTYEVALLGGVVLSVLAQCGDLFESAIKRRAGIKDSGSLLPGHGGIMDRVDSLLFPFGAIAIVAAIMG